MLERASLFLCLVCVTLAGQTQSGWQLSKEKNGIKIYTKKADSSSFKAIKVECVFEGTWERLAAILMDIKLQEQWVYRSKKAYAIKKISENEILYYTETSLPWPISHRDAVVRMKLYYDPASKMNRVLSVNEPKVLPEKKGLIRIQHYKATWEVKPVEKNKIAITYFLEVDPAGSLPAWVVNMFITTGPYETFAKLAELLKK